MTLPLVSIGEIIAGKYRIDRVIGHGAVGIVVLATHDELEQRVAIKLLNAQTHADPEWIGRFSREARTAAKMKSEHVVRVFDVGKLENGAPYMVMEYLEGDDLQGMLSARGRLPIHESVSYLLQAFEAIAEAHALGVIHRDLKPANIFVDRRIDGSPRVKVLDFGISKVIGDQDLAKLSSTSTTTIVGSPLYMSPEQMKASRLVDARSDIWSLGIILHELVTGEPAYDAETVPELCALVLTAEPKPLTEALEGAPLALQLVIQKCLQRDPAKRYQTVVELAEALAPFAPAEADLAISRMTRLVQAVARQTASQLSSVPPPAAEGRSRRTPSMFPNAATRDEFPAPQLTRTSAPTAMSQKAASAAQPVVPLPSRHGKRGRLMVAAIFLVGLLGAGGAVFVRSARNASRASGSGDPAAAALVATTSTVAATSHTSVAPLGPAESTLPTLDSASAISPVGMKTTGKISKAHALGAEGGIVPASPSGDGAKAGINSPPGAASAAPNADPLGFGGRN